jgi:hypothetical protein
LLLLLDSIAGASAGNFEGRGKGFVGEAREKQKTGRGERAIVELGPLLEIEE